MNSDRLMKPIGSKIVRIRRVTSLRLSLVTDTLSRGKSQVPVHLNVWSFLLKKKNVFFFFFLIFEALTMMSAKLLK